MAITKAGESQSFGYTGGMQSFTAPFDGLYQMEVYGAVGGNNTYNMGNRSGTGGYGGTATGYTLLKKGTVLYICCGGAGTHNTSGETGVSGGYNGGGSVNHNYYKGASGGGSTHIATVAGTLSNIGAGNLSKILIIAGGGGGAAAEYNGGSGGGTVGGTGSHKSESGEDAPIVATGGNQSSGGTGYYNGTFGQGGAGGHGYYGGAGGGGLYGGGGGQMVAAGGGGSGYIGGVPAITYRGITYSPSWSNGVNGGNGSAKITLIQKSVPPVYLGTAEISGIFLGSTEIVDIK